MRYPYPNLSPTSLALSPLPGSGAGPASQNLRVLAFDQAAHKLDAVQGAPRLAPAPTNTAIEQTPTAHERYAGPLRESERRLVQAIRLGQREAARPLYDTLRASIESTLYRVLRAQPTEFEDLKQITYERVIRSIALGKFEGRSQLNTWASAIAAHVALDFLRRRTQEQRLFEALGTANVRHMSDLIPERQLEARSEFRKIQGILHRMKRRPAVVLVLHDMLGHSVPEIAELLGMKASAAQTTLRRARVEFVRRCGSTLRPSDQS